MSVEAELGCLPLATTANENLTNPMLSCSPLGSPGMRAKLLQSCLILCDPMDCGPPGSSVHGILQEY